MDSPQLTHWGGIPDPEKLDPTPMEIPVGHTQPTPLNELIARFVANELQTQSEGEPESYEEANDFEEPEDPGLLDITKYTLTELEDETPEDTPPAEPDDKVVDDEVVVPGPEPENPSADPPAQAEKA